MAILKEAIKSEILNSLNHSEFCSYHFLATKNNVSISTIKRYCLELKKENKLKIIRSGVSLKDDFVFTNTYKKNLNVDKKIQIGKKAMKKIRENDLVFMDAGTTTIELAKLLKKNSRITIFTNNADILNHLKAKNITTYFIGGKLNFTTNAICGSLAVDTISKINFSVAFLGCNGYDQKAFYTTNIDEAIVKQKVIERSQRSYMLCDTSKKNVLCSYKIVGRDQVELVLNDCLR